MRKRMKKRMTMRRKDDDEILYDIADTLEDIAEHNVTIIASLAEIKEKVSKMDEIYEILKRIEMNTRKEIGEYLDLAIKKSYSQRQQGLGNHL